MPGATSFKFVLLPPHSDTTRDWAKRLAQTVPEVCVIVAEDADMAAREIVNAEAAFGWLSSDLLLKARKLRWLQAPQAAPPAGYYYPELIAHSVVVTNFREIFNDHIGAHILAFVLAFARGPHIFIPQQFRREWKKSPSESGDVVHLPEATALIVGVGGIGSEAARLLSAFGVTVLGTDARRTTAPDGVAELRRHKAGRIVNIASLAGIAPGGSSIAYAASKAGLIHLTHCLAVAMAPDVTVNCIAPGLVEGTRMAERVPEEMKRRGPPRAQAVLGRTGSADDIAEQAVTFCRAETVTGQVVVVDGGLPAGMR